MEVVAVLISLVALIVSALAAISERRALSNANTLVTVDLLREHGEPPFVKARFYIVRQNLEGADISKGLQGIPDNQRLQVIELLAFYDLIAALHVHRVINTKPIDNYIGGAAIGVYRKMEECIEAERKIRGYKYLDHFKKWVGHMNSQIPKSYIS
ncbi:hypothetical protein J5X07_05345 [Actinomyces bowdenii]|uniref:DUF4760 domain-containing protein n=1 Tax=Actinomyces bowdenii TaxID=131109 RepID=UPI001ABC1B9F|nr:hypothetical protein [Actinomyces bowdenii]MBO3724458.1 hypothetical protein [Actinomyces bowdenii]